MILRDKLTTLTFVFRRVSTYYVVTRTFEHWMHEVAITEKKTSMVEFQLRHLGIIYHDYDQLYEITWNTIIHYKLSFKISFACRNVNYDLPRLKNSTYPNYLPSNKIGGVTVDVNCMHFNVYKPIQVELTHTRVLRERKRWRGRQRVAGSNPGTLINFIESCWIVNQS